MSCGLFIFYKTSQFVYQVDLIFMLSINSHAFTTLSFDEYRYVCGNFLFYKSCFRHIKELKLSKFGTTNIINVCVYQDYQNVLQKFKLVKKTVISCIRPIISIHNLRLSDPSLMSSYHQIHDHTVILLQNPDLLINLLLFNTFLLYKIIRVV